MGNYSSQNHNLKHHERSVAQTSENRTSEQLYERCTKHA